MRASGILLPIFSLPSNGGIGTLGECAYRFVDKLREAGQKYWQILPICPTASGDSPYLSFCSKAGNPYFIDLDKLCQKGWLKPLEYKDDTYHLFEEKIDYQKLLQQRMPILYKAFRRFIPDTSFNKFCRETPWLDDYAQFMALKDLYGGACWRCWPAGLRDRDEETLRKITSHLATEILFYKFVQYCFFEQWWALKEYANARGIKIIGDEPIYVAYDSVDIWASPWQFQLRPDGLPSVVSGCPPDAFSPKGQLWGSPVYDWEYMRTQSQPYEWWKERFSHAFSLYDVVRIDHFRGFESYYCIPYGALDAVKGEWRKGPGFDFFQTMQNYFAEMPIIAEDLGFMTEEVRQLLKDTAFPGMKVLQFAFEGAESSDHLPHNYSKRCVVYIGTHDNPTLLGWLRKLKLCDLERIKEYLSVATNKELPQALMRLAMMSVADISILTVQDIFALDDKARINTPGTVGKNWRWRMSQEMLDTFPSKDLYRRTKLYGRTEE